MAVVICPGGLRAPCVRHACALRAPCVGHAFLASFSLSFSFLFFFSPSFAFDSIRGNSRGRKFDSPNLLGKLEDICNKKNVSNFDLFTKKTQIFLAFFDFLRPAFQE